MSDYSFFQIEVNDRTYYIPGKNSDDAGKYYSQPGDILFIDPSAINENNVVWLGSPDGNSTSYDYNQLATLTGSANDFIWDYNRLYGLMGVYSPYQGQPGYEILTTIMDKLRTIIASNENFKRTMMKIFLSLTGSELEYFKLLLYDILNLAEIICLRDMVGMNYSEIEAQLRIELTRLEGIISNLPAVFYDTPKGITIRENILNSLSDKNTLHRFIYYQGGPLNYYSNLIDEVYRIRNAITKILPEIKTLARGLSRQQPKLVVRDTLAGIIGQRVKEIYPEASEKLIYFLTDYALGGTYAEDLSKEEFMDLLAKNM